MAYMCVWDGPDVLLIAARQLLAAELRHELICHLRERKDSIARGFIAR
jgi:hypothetical protein